MTGINKKLKKYDITDRCDQYMAYSESRASLQIWRCILVITLLTAALVCLIYLATITPSEEEQPDEELDVLVGDHGATEPGHEKWNVEKMLERTEEFGAAAVAVMATACIVLGLALLWCAYCCMSC